MTMRDYVVSTIVCNPHQIIGDIPLSIEDYSFFLFPGKLHGNQYIYDKKRHSDLFNKLANIYTYMGAQFIHKSGIAFSLEKATKKDLFINPEKHISAIKYSYEKECSQPIELFNKAIGIGFTGLTFEYDEKQVIKVAFSRFKENELVFWNYQKNNNLPCFPYTSYVDSIVVIREKVLTKTDKLSRFKSYIEKHVILNYLEEISYRTINTPLEELPHEFQSFVLSIQNSLYDIFNIKCIGDLKIENIGERIHTREIVMFDPIGGFIDNYSRIIKHQL